MLKSLFISLFLFLSVLVNCQYSIESSSKSELGIPSITTFKKRYLPSDLKIKTEKFREREKYINFYEADSTIYYYYSDTLYDLYQPKKYFVEHKEDFLYEQNYHDTILDYINKFKPNIKKDKLSYLIDSQNRIWFFSNRYSGIMLIIDNRLIQFNYTTGFRHDYISNIQEDFNGNIWVNSSSGVSVFANKRWTTLDKTNKGKNVGGVKKVLPFSNNQILILTSRGKILSYKDGYLKDLEISKRKKNYYRNLGPIEELRTVNFNNNKPYDILANDTSEVWISFSNNELCKLNAKNELTFYVETNKSWFNKLINYYTDSYGTKWIIAGNKIIKLNENNHIFESIPFDGLYFKGFFEEKQRLWFFGNVSSVYYDYQKNELFDINKEFEIKREATDLSTALYALGNVGAQARIDYYYSGIIEYGFDNSLYLQYGIGTITSNYAIIEVEKLKEDSLILLFLERNCINLTDELKDKDNRPLGAYLDSFGNFWIDTPTSIHKISLK